jgi:hypothetical protein
LDSCQDRTFAKIPEQGKNWKQVYVSKADLQRLTDEEFLFLWMLPNLDIRVSKRAGEYVDERRRLLELKQSDQSGVMEEGHHLPGNREEGMS